MTIRAGCTDFDIKPYMEKLEQWRVAMPVGRIHMARLVGISYNTYYLLLKGEKRLLRFQTVMRIQKYIADRESGKK